MSALALLVLLAVEQTPAAKATARCRDRLGARVRCAVDSYTPAHFEFAPLTGEGMTTACDCATPTGFKGETMTFSRASSGTCLKRGTTTGIANGDMVTCSTNQPRVMPGGDGTGALGLLMEEFRENVVLRSEEFDNAAWSNQTFGGIAAITITADQAVAPDGTTTADRFQIPAVTVASGGYTLRSQLSFGNAGRSASVFLKGNGESGTFHILIAGTALACAICSYNPTTWTRCERASPGNTTNFHLGSDPLDCGGGDQPAKDVFVWGAQYETNGASGANSSAPSSYIKTTSASVSRAADAASFSLGTMSAGTASTAVTAFFTSQYQSGGNPIPLYLRLDANNVVSHFYSAPNEVANYVVGGANNTVTSAGSVSLGGFNRVGSYSTGSQIAVCLAGTCTTAATALTVASGTWTAHIGSASGAGFIQGGVVKQVCIDMSPSRCR